MKVVLLGTGTPNAEPDRSGPAVAVIHRGSAYLVDCGPGVVRQAAGACRNGHRELAFPNLKDLFITHLHSDHTAGLPDLILTPWVLDRTRPLRIHGPDGTAAMVSHITEAYSIDIHQRLSGPEPANGSGYRTEVHEIREGRILEENGLEVDAFRVRHGGFEAFSYRFSSKEKTAVISGDTAPAPGMADFCRDCDVLVHEVYSLKGLSSREPEWKQYHSSVHTSTAELAALAREAGPGILVLYHELLHGVSPEVLTEEVSSACSSRTVYGRDMDSF